MTYIAKYYFKYIHGVNLCTEMALFSGGYIYRIEEFLAEVDYFTSVVLYHTCSTVSYM